MDIDTIERELGGYRAVALYLGVSDSCVSMWKFHIPRKRIKPLATLARMLGKPHIDEMVLLNATPRLRFAPPPDESRRAA